MHLKLGSITIAPNIWQAVAIIALIFALLLVLAYMSRNFLEWSLSGFGVGLFIGILLTILLEGFLLIGGKSIVTGLLSWKGAPPQIQNVLNSGHQKLLDTLNVPASCSATIK